jgi:hypothetical protein
MSQLPRHDGRLVTTSRRLIAEGVDRAVIAREVKEGRWRRAGLAIVMHNGPLSSMQRRWVARIHAGPQSVFTAFTAAELCGLTGWERDEVHVLAPAGTRMRAGCPVPAVLHLHAPGSIRRHPNRGVEALPDALVRAAATFVRPRPACGLLAAAVQQRAVRSPDIIAALERASRTRHQARLAGRDG